MKMYEVRRPTGTGLIIDAKKLSSLARGILRMTLLSIAILYAISDVATAAESSSNTAETIFFLSDDLKSAVRYYSKRGEYLPHYTFLFNSDYDRNSIMYARPENYSWQEKEYKGDDYRALVFPYTSNYAYMEKYDSTGEFLHTDDKIHYKLVINGSQCMGDGCIQDESIIVAVLPQKFKVTKYAGDVEGTWKIVGNTYSFYARHIQGASIAIEFEDTIPYVYAELAKVLSQFKDIRVSYDGNNVRVAMPVEGVFASGDATIRKNGETWIQVFGKTLKNAEVKELRVEGHSDNVPIHSRTYPSNWELSAARAATVVRYLAGLGIDPKRLAAVGYADSRPVADNRSDESRRKNRRIEFTIVPEAVKQDKNANN